MNNDSLNSNLDELIAELRKTALQQNPAKAVVTILENWVADLDGVIKGMPDFEDDEVILFEDDSISIWHCRFMPGTTVPAHDHQMMANIAVYSGVERNDFYLNNAEHVLSKSGEVLAPAGNVVTMSPDAIHTVSCVGEEPSCGIHVYLGNLSKVSRSLFDVANNEEMPFTDDNYSRLDLSDECARH